MNCEQVNTMTVSRLYSKKVVSEQNQALKSRAVCNISDKKKIVISGALGGRQAGDISWMGFANDVARHFTPPRKPGYIFSSRTAQIRRITHLSLPSPVSWYVELKFIFPLKSYRIAVKIHMNFNYIYRIVTYQMTDKNRISTRYVFLY